MQFSHLKNWILKNIVTPQRIQLVSLWYLLSLMVEERKHSLTAAATLSGMNKSQFSRFLKSHHNIAIQKLDNLSKSQAKQFGKVLKCLQDSLHWKIAIIVDSTIQHRSTRHTENGKKFNHGQGFVIGHQWTNIILIINGMIIPLPPIPYYSKKYCNTNGLTYNTEHELIIEYFESLNLKDYGLNCKPQEVIVLGDSGYDDQNIEKAIVKKEWNFIIALKKTRSVKSKEQFKKTRKNENWTQIAEFFRTHRWLKWQTIHISVNRHKKKRMDFRTRHFKGHLRYIGEVLLVCSEFKKRPDGRRKYLACNDLKATARQILIGYRIRWSIETFHKKVKMFLGFEDVATWNFNSVQSHVHWVYCAYLLLEAGPPGVTSKTKSMVEKQQKIRKIIGSKKISNEIQILTQINGKESLKNELKRALQVA